MRVFCVVASLAVLACWGVADAEPDVKSKETAAAISRAATSADASGVLRALPGIERVWDEDPEEYLRLVQQAAPVLRGGPGPDARAAALALFTRTMEKRSPSGMEQAIAYFDLKREIVLDYLNLEEIRTDKAHLLDVAAFIGEVRPRLIPGYRNRGTVQPGLPILIEAGVQDPASLTDPKLKEAYARAVRQNEEDLKMNDLQRALFRANEILTFHLLHNAARFPAERAENADFLATLSETAHFTPAERTRLTVRTPAAGGEDVPPPAQ